MASITNTGAISSFSSYGATTVDIGAPVTPSIVSSVPGGRLCQLQRHFHGRLARHRRRGPLCVDVSPAGIAASAIRTAAPQHRRANGIAARARQSPAVV
ncbi:MAG UNVERIFIED_CONTAM: hypothetical protein LVR18_26985 [Planctomycetaceae bacterium]